jgi:hypothetical protein
VLVLPVHEERRKRLLKKRIRKEFARWALLERFQPSEVEVAKERQILTQVDC